MSRVDISKLWCSLTALALSADFEENMDLFSGSAINDDRSNLHDSDVVSNYLKSLIYKKTGSGRDVFVDADEATEFANIPELLQHIAHATLCEVGMDILVNGVWMTSHRFIFWNDSKVIHVLSGYKGAPRVYALEMPVAEWSTKIQSSDVKDFSKALGLPLWLVKPTLEEEANGGTVTVEYVTCDNLLR